VNPLVRTALTAAQAAASVHRRDASRVSGVAVTEKARADYVSQTDLDAQEAALGVIRERHPDHAVLAEEGEGSVEDRISAWDGRPLWVVDPLDGTANFLHGHPHYCASVAIAVEGRPVAGAVVSGSSGERWWAAEGEGAFKGGRPIRVSSRSPLRDALVGTGFPFKNLELLPDYLGQLDRVLRAASGVRRGGSAALDLCYLAEGRLDAFWEEILMPWDFAAGIVLVREAGGVLVGAGGNELSLKPGRVRGANSAAVLDELMGVLRAPR
jgi:myo-inositol-1(or 4)-monophosphatase